MTTKREAVYDAEISPLMVQIIALCQAHDIPHVASFQLDDERPVDANFCCSTVRVPPDACARIKRAHAGLYPRPEMFAITVSSNPRCGDE